MAPSSSLFCPCDSWRASVLYDFAPPWRCVLHPQPQGLIYGSHGEWSCSCTMTKCACPAKCLIKHHTDVICNALQLYQVERWNVRKVIQDTTIQCNPLSLDVTWSVNRDQEVVHIQKSQRRHTFLTNLHKVYYTPCADLTQRWSDAPRRLSWEEVPHKGMHDRAAIGVRPVQKTSSSTERWHRFNSDTTLKRPCWGIWLSLYI